MHFNTDIKEVRDWTIAGIKVEVLRKYDIWRELTAPLFAFISMQAL